MQHCNDEAAHPRDRIRVVDFATRQRRGLPKREHGETMKPLMNGCRSKI